MAVKGYAKGVYLPTIVWDTLAKIAKKSPVRVGKVSVNSLVLEAVTDLINKETRKVKRQKLGKEFVKNEQ